MVGVVANSEHRLTCRGPRENRVNRDRKQKKLFQEVLL